MGGGDPASDLTPSRFWDMLGLWRWRDGSGRPARVSGEAAMVSSSAACSRSVTTAAASSVEAAPDRQARLEALRRRIEQIQARHRRTSGKCRTGLAALDAALGGGLLRSAVHELIAAGQVAGAQTLALHLALAAARSDGGPAGIECDAGGVPHRPILWLDPQQTFYPPAAAALGVDLDRLLVGRCASQADVLWLAEQALRCPAIVAVVLPVRTIEPRCLRRLQLAAEAGGAVGLLVLDQPTGHAFAASRLVVEPLAPGDDGDEATAAWTQSLRIRIDRLQGGAPGREVEVRLPLDAAARCVSRVGDCRPRLVQTA